MLIVLSCCSLFVRIHKWLGRVVMSFVWLLAGRESRPPSTPVLLRAATLVLSCEGIRDLQDDPEVEIHHLSPTSEVMDSPFLALHASVPRFRKVAFTCNCSKVCGLALTSRLSPGEIKAPQDYVQSCSRICFRGNGRPGV